MRRTVLACAGFALWALPAMAQSADDVIAKYVKAIGGLDKVRAVTTLRRAGKFIGSGGFEAAVTQENKRAGLVREEFLLQDLTGVNAYDGRTGWKIQPWQGKKDPEPLGEEEMKSIIEDADFDGPLVDYQKKGNKVEYVGQDEVDGTDTYKLKVALRDDTVLHYYLDAEYYVPIKIDTRRMIRGAEREYETTVGDYKQVAGWYLPYSYETNAKGSTDKSTIVYDKIEANVPIDDSRFHMPAAAKTQGAKP